MMAAIALAGCSDERETPEAFNPAGYAVTASVTNVEAVSRVVDKNDQTVFQQDDPIFADLTGGTTAAYRYEYTGENGVFRPASANGNTGLWQELAGASAPADVYAWYGKTTDGKLPAVGDAVIATPDQRKENDYLANIYMTAHTAVTDPLACKELHFNFTHLMACLKVHIKIDDMGVSPSDMIGTTATVKDARNSATLAMNSSNDHTLTIQGGTTADIRMYRVNWDEQEPYLVDFKCLLPPQTLPAGQEIGLTLSNGKTYTCKLEDALTTLNAGKETTLNISIVSEGETVFKPQTSIFTNAPGGDFSGNRIMSAIKNPSTDEYRFRVFDRRPDGSWGEGELVYEDEAGTIEYPTQHNDYLKSGGAIKIYGDYAVIGYGGMGTYAAKTFFIKKSKTTGKWFRANGPIGFCGYDIAISNNFLITGNHVNAGHGYNTYVYPINEDGNLEAGYIVSGMSGYKMSLSGNVLATNNGLFVYNEGSEKWEQKLSWGGNTRRIATDGQRVIVQDGGGVSNVIIYRIDQTNNSVTVTTEGWDGSPARAGVDKPVGIYGNYALAGGNNWVHICYRDPNTGKWKNLGSILPLLKRWNPKEFESVTQLTGGSIIQKGTRALIASEGTIYFIENIDKMVEDWLANPE